jgi:hypothetical protein
LFEKRVCVQRPESGPESGHGLRGFAPVDFGSTAFFSGRLPATISSFTFFSRLNSSIHCSNVKLLTFGTFTVRSSQLSAITFPKVEIPVAFLEVNVVTEPSEFVVDGFERASHGFSAYEDRGSFGR